MSDSIKDRVLKVIDKQLNKDTSQIKLTDRFNEDLGAVCLRKAFSIDGIYSPEEINTEQ